jgi:hypothetical protein
MSRGLGRAGGQGCGAGRATGWETFPRGEQKKRKSPLSCPRRGSPSPTAALQRTAHGARGAGRCSFDARAERRCGDREKRSASLGEIKERTARGRRSKRAATSKTATRGWDSPLPASARSSPRAAIPTSTCAVLTRKVCLQREAASGVNYLVMHHRTVCAGRCAAQGRRRRFVRPSVIGVRVASLLAVPVGVCLHVYLHGCAGVDDA